MFVAFGYLSKNTKELKSRIANQFKQDRESDQMDLKHGTILRVTSKRTGWQTEMKADLSAASDGRAMPEKEKLPAKRMEPHLPKYIKLFAAPIEHSNSLL